MGGCEKMSENNNRYLPNKSEPYRHLNETEVCCLILPYVVENVKISNRELARLTGLDNRTIGKYRQSDKFTKMLVEHTNKEMLIVRSIAIEELEKLLMDEDLNPNTKVKAIHEALSHSERMTELLIQSGKEPEHIDINVLLKEIENM